MNLQWSADSTILAGAGATGQVLLAFTVDKSISWENYEINLESDNKIKVDDLINELNEDLEFRDRVISMSMAYGQLIVTTISHCYIYSTNVNSQVISELAHSPNN